jgi:hypothetical protein
MNEFEEAVRYMRQCQKEYFANRNYTSLSNSMAAERVVDRMLLEKQSDAKQLSLEMEVKP